MRARPGAGRGYSITSGEEPDVEAANDAEEGAKRRGPPAAWRFLSLLKSLQARQKLLLLFLAFCFLEQALEESYGLRLTGLGRMVLLPVRLTGYATHMLLLLAPATCAGALWAWHWLAAALPEAGGQAGQPIVEGIRFAGYSSFLLLCLLALDGDPLVRGAATAYGLAGAAALARRAWGDRALRRAVRTWALFLPLIAHYKALEKWVGYAQVGKEQERRAYERLHARYAPKVYGLMVDLGGLYVKAGQLLSLVPAGVLPAAYTREFKKMQSDCPSRPSEEVQRQVAEALGRPIGEIFSSFGEKAIGTASISQVHKARLAKDGREVVVKVQYPDLAESIDADFGSIALIVGLLDRSKVEEVREAKRHFDSELDFEVEAETLERVHGNMKQAFPAVRIPEPVRELCTPTVLVMSFIPGTSFLDGIMRMAEALCKTVGASVDDVVAGAAAKLTGEPKALEPKEEGEADAAEGQEALPLMDATEPGGWKSKLGTAAAQRVNPVRVLQTCMSTSRAALNVGVAMYNFSVGRLGATPLEYRQSLPTFDPVKLSKTIWRVHGHQLLLDGLFNSDPHPGNILIDDKAIGLIDFGQVCELCLETRVRFARLLLALAEGGETEIAKRHAQLGFRTRRMATETLALNARLRFGAITEDFMQKIEHVKTLERKDPILRQRHDEKFVMAERLITILRGTSFICGVGKAHSAPGLWLDMAQALLKEHGASCLPEEAGTDAVELDLEPAEDAAGLPALPAPELPPSQEGLAWDLGAVPLGEEEFFEVESEDEGP